MYRNTLCVLPLLCVVLTVEFTFGDADKVNADQQSPLHPLLNLRQFPLPLSGVGYHAHDCPEETWTLCKVYEIQEDKSLKPYSGQLNWEAYNASGKVIANSCCTQEDYLKALKVFLKPGDVYFIAALKDGEVLLSMPYADAEPNVPHFSALPIWTYNDSVQCCPPYHEFCLECNKLHASDFSEQSMARGGPRLHNSLNLYVPAKSSVVVTRSPSEVAEVPVYYVISNEALSAYYKTIKRTGENGTVDFHVSRDKNDLGFYALHGGCLHSCKKKPDSNNVFEVELPDNMVTLVLKKDGEVLHRQRVIITDTELNSTISAVDLISDELGQVKFTPPPNSQYRILVFGDMFQQYVSQPIQPSTKAETVIFDIAVGKKEKGDNAVPAAVSLSKEGNTDQTDPRVVIPEPRRFWKDFQLTSAFGRVEDKSEIREFNVYEILQKTKTHIDNRFSLIEMLFLERVLYSQYYTELSEYLVREKQSIQPALAPVVPSL